MAGHTSVPLLCSLLALFVSAASTRGEEKVDFNYDIQPIISGKCFQCHGPDEKARKAKLRLDRRADAIKERGGVRAIAPGDLAASELIIRITTTDADEIMPPPDDGHPLSPREIELLKRWIAEGAEYKPHWSFLRPTRPPVPIVADRERKADHPIDAFIRARLEPVGLRPAPPAERHALLRRVTLDLTGLPPVPSEVEAFIDDSSPAAYEKVVDRLLASPAYGERWAKMWLDLARYADSTGYGSDMFRLNMWPYRDWVIRALNKNLSYAQFTKEQIAGDLLPNATDEQIAATAFHRNTMTNVEGGTDDEEYRVVAVKDRVATTGQVWMGLTFGCAQCHSHKFDPISHKEYYQLFGIFNQTEDSDRQDEAPRIPLPTAEEKAQREKLLATVETLEARIKSSSSELEAEQHLWEAEMHQSIDWQPLEIDQLTAEGGAKLEQQPDGSIIATGRSAYSDTFTIRATTAASQVTAIRLELLPESEARGSAVLSEFQINAAPVNATPVRGRYLRIALPGTRKILSLAEVQVFSGEENIARRGKASQSSTAFGGAPERAIDGNTDGDFFKANSVTHTREERDPWWEVDLQGETTIDSIALWNRTDPSVSDRLKGFRLVILDAAKKPVWEEVVGAVPKPNASYRPVAGAKVALQNASTDFPDESAEVAQAIDNNPETNWKFPLTSSTARSAVFEADKAFGYPAGTRLTFSVMQNHGEEGTLGRFRISITSKAPPVRQLPDAVRAILAIEPSERTESDRSELFRYFRPLAASTRKTAQEIESTKGQLARIKAVELPIMRELPSVKRRKTFILNKGNFTAPGEEVSAGLPVAFHEPPKRETIDRLALAEWLVSPQNPLTARVAVNRYWSQLFGTGLVESEEDFGTQGALPTHPELLDWLAVEFMEKGWDVKALIKTIVLSATYQQSSRSSAEHLQKDAGNRFLSRSSRRRLDAETVRDQALALSGLLSGKIGGPSVYPPQPDGLWNVAFNGGQNAYPTSSGEDRYRRGIYTFWRRTMPNPTMTTFDAPSRETCTLRRSPTNTPLQAFVTLNDPVFVECAQALARRIVREGGASTAKRVRFGLELCLARPAESEQIGALIQLYETELETFRANGGAARKLASEPLGALPAELDAAEAAAWTVVANVLLNLDALLTKS